MMMDEMAMPQTDGVMVFVLFSAAYGLFIGLYAAASLVPQG